ncbi:hypothetical protein SDRG_08564 [Saprolegnia diclina VS20]|uniref:Uncharacterized protein n=1 Tax=Saprolegnia diclina (strain VS20) TaxID=1156394 RepID=T0RNE6_SAPDV|nr:hypothetical protein SDRG_08564 [Saprolegnia diclina VS20]EQC33883.1 hypothetical protein SDRG_08564 [Saprolegnia diclina VS20]|eukprot:XP_008612678.1 hypothetical protein SDRG_08564 [Saprolegnia diclina VS20]
MPELSFRDIRQNNSARCTAYHKSLQYAVAKTLARDDSRGLLLLQRFGPRPDDLKNYERRLAIQEATLANLTLALDLFPWLFYPSLMDDIAGRGFLPLVRLLHERGVDCSTDAMDKVAANGHLEVVCFLHLYRREGCTSYAMDIAAGNGHLDVVTFLHVNRSEGCTVDALDRAISNGQLDVVRFLLEHRFEGASLNVLDDAAVNGHFGVVQYLHSLGSFGCTVGAVDGAARCGHLEIVTFLLTHRSEGCTLDNVVDIAMAHGQLQTAEYLLSLGCPFPTSMSRCDEDAFRKPEMVGVMQLLIARGYSMESKWLFKACEVNNVPLVRFLCSHLGTASRRKALHTAMWAMAWDVVRYLLATDTKEVSARTQLKQALCSGNFEAAAHILQDQPGLSSASRLKGCLNLEATRYLLSAGDFRECLVTLAGRQQHVTASKSLLPYCMHAIDHLDNVSFLLDLLALPNRRRATILQLITPELLDQGKKASESTQLASCAAARASAQLEAGEVVDWALALVIGHLHVTNATPTIEQLEKKISLVQDGQLQMQLTRQQTQASR